MTVESRPSEVGEREGGGGGGVVEKGPRVGIQTRVAHNATSVICWRTCPLSYQR